MRAFCCVQSGFESGWRDEEKHNEKCEFYSFTSHWIEARHCRFYNNQQCHNCRECRIKEFATISTRSFYVRRTIRRIDEKVLSVHCTHSVKTIYIFMPARNRKNIRNSSYTLRDWYTFCHCAVRNNFTTIIQTHGSIDQIYACIFTCRAVTTLQCCCCYKLSIFNIIFR